MPRRYTIEMPSRLTSSASASTPASSDCIPVGTSSQPSRLAMDCPISPFGWAPQTETSRRQMRPIQGRRSWAIRPVYNQRIMINVTPAAASKITELLQEENKLEAGLRVFVQGGGCSGFQYGLMIDEGEGDAATDSAIHANGAELVV